jgi:integrase
MACGLFEQYLAERNVDYRAVTADDMAAFVQWLRCPAPRLARHKGRQAATRSAATINHYLTAVFSLYGFLRRAGYVHHDLGTHLGLVVEDDRQRSRPGLLQGIAYTTATRNLLRQREPLRYANILSPDEIGQLLGACANLRDQLVVRLSCEALLRPGELVLTQVHDVDVAQRTLRVQPGSGYRGRARLAPLSDGLVASISNYVETVRAAAKPGSNTLLVKLHGPRTGQPMDYTDLANLFTRLRKGTGIKVTATALRTSGIAYLHQAGAPYAHLAYLSGTTCSYTSTALMSPITPERLRAAVAGAVARIQEVLR